MRIALVGNGPVDYRHASEIDAHDMVIRFNACPHYGRAGRRIDILVLMNAGSPGWRFTTKKKALNKTAVTRAREIWFAVHPVVQQETRGDDPHSGDYAEAIVRDHLNGQRWTYIDREDHIAARIALHALGAPADNTPTSGMLALIHARRILNPSHVTLYGFTHEGWEGHPWDAERRFVDMNSDWITRVETQPTSALDTFAGHLHSAFHGWLPAQKSHTYSTCE